MLSNAGSVDGLVHKLRPWEPSAASGEPRARGGAENCDKFLPHKARAGDRKGRMMASDRSHIMLCKRSACVIGLFLAKQFFFGEAGYYYEFNYQGLPGRLLCTKYK